MYRIVTVILIFGLVFEFAFSIPNNYDTTMAEKKADSDKLASQMWFGPRLGRRKRNDEIYRSELEREQLSSLLDALQDSPWAIVAVNDGKRHISTYVPRLGRESDEDVWLMESELPPYAHRLGRKLSPFSPRLGRYADKMAA